MPIGLPAIHGKYAPLVAGRFYDPYDLRMGERSAYASASAFTTGTQFAYPVFIQSTTTVKALGIEVVGTQAAQTVRLGIYNDASGYPGALMYGGGALSSASAAVVQETGLSTILPEGWYWWSLQSSHSTPTFRICVEVAGATNSFPTLGQATMGATGAAISGVSVTQAYGAFASTFPALGTYGTVAIFRMMIGV